MKQPKTRLTEEQAKERDDALRAAGITVVTDPPGAAVITPLKRSTATENANAADGK